MRKTIIIGLMALASMMCNTSFAQDIYKTAAGVPMVQLNNGILMPQFGLGTFMQPSDEVCEQSCLTALKAGYRSGTCCEEQRYSARRDMDYQQTLAYGIR